MAQNALSGSQGATNFSVGTTDSVFGGGDFCINFKLKYGTNTLNQKYSFFTTGASVGEGNPQILLGLDVDGVFWIYSGGYATGTTQLTWTLNQWYDIEVNYTSGSVKFYVDGVLKETLTKTPTSQAGMWLCGGVVNGSVAGVYDEFRFSNIQRHTANFTPSEEEFTNDANTLVLWHLNEGTGTSAADSSSNAHTGTVNLGGSTWVAGYTFTAAASGSQKNRIMLGVG